jgi:hypothetical protein
VTAIPGRRRRSTWIGLAAAIAALAAVLALTSVGVQTLADSRAGHLADGHVEERPVQRLPFTPTALVGTIDDAGRLTSIVVMALEPNGVGGSIVELAASADTNSGNTGQLAPFNAVLAVRGPDALRSSVEALTGVSFDVVELIDQARFAQIVGPLGDLPTTLPIALYDASSGEQWPAGDDVLAGATAARVVTAVDPAIDDWLFEPGRAAIWRAVAERVGAGIGTAAPVASDADLPRPQDLDDFLLRLFASRVQFRALSVIPIAPDRVEEQLPLDLGVAFGVPAKDSVAVHDRAELLMVMGAVAPGRVGAPLEAPSFRVVMGLTDDDLEPLGVRGSDVLKQAITRLLFARVNVVSVAELPGSPVPEHSTFSVADESTIDAVQELYSGVFGDSIEVRRADALLEGVDITLVLGLDFLDVISDDLESQLAGSADDSSSAEVSTDGSGEGDDDSDSSGDTAGSGD